jgi:hypothetical protein
MKKNLLCAIGLSLAILLSAYTHSNSSRQPRWPCVYLIYQGWGFQDFVFSYTWQWHSPGPCPGSETLCWICVEDLDGDAHIDQNELDYFFSIYDSNFSGSLDDESEIFGKIEKKGWY